jgi:hypothetical protein
MTLQSRIALHLAQHIDVRLRRSAQVVLSRNDGGRHDGSAVTANTVG